MSRGRPDGAALWPTAGGVLLRVRLTPNARVEAIEGERLLADGTAALAVRVRAIPEDGAANAALEALLAKAAGVAKSRVRVVAGHAQRLKTLRIEGEEAAVAAALGLPAI